MSVEAPAVKPVALAPDRPKAGFLLGGESSLAPKLGLEIEMSPEDAQAYAIMRSEEDSAQRTTQMVLEEALKASDRRAVQHPMSVIAWSQAGLAAIAARKLERAEGYFRRALELDPSHRGATIGLARCLFELGRADESERLLKDLLKGHEADGDALVGLGVILVSQLRFGDALAILPEHPPAKGAGAILALRGGIQLAKGNFQGAVSDLRKALRIGPERATIRNALGIAELKAGNVERAERIFREVMRTAPFYLEGEANLLRTLAQQERFEDVVNEASKRHLPHNASAAIARIVGSANLRLKRWRAAAPWLERSISAAEDNETRAQSLNDLGCVYGNLGEHARAAALFEQSLSEQVSEWAIINRAKAFLNMNSPGSVISWLQEHRAPGIVDRVQRFKLSAQALLQMGDVSGSLLVVEEAIRERVADDETAGLAVAIAVDNARDPERAIRLGEQALLRFPDSELLINNLAYSLLMADRVERAEELLRPFTAGEKQPSFFITATMGLLALKRGDIAEGRRLYSVALGMAAADQMREKVRAKRDLEVARALWRIDAVKNTDEVKQLLARASHSSPDAEPYVEDAKRELRTLRSGPSE